MSRRSSSVRAARSVVVSSCALACWLAVGVLPAGALSSHDQVLLGSPRLEIYPAASDSLLAWSESTHAHPRFFQAYVRPIAGGSRTRLNADGTKGYTGGIDGTEVVFQQVADGHSDIRIFDTATGHYVVTPPGVDTGDWEGGPTMSGNFLLFFREHVSGGRYAVRVVLHNTSTGRETILDAAAGRFHHRGPFVLPGQVNGDWATWNDCRVRRGCDVLVRRISTGHTVQIPDHGQEYASSVASDGTVFFIRSGNGCGTRARLMRYQGGSATLVRDFAKNRDSFSTYALSSTQVVREVDNCKTNDADVNLTTIS